MHTLKEVITILADKLEADINDHSYRDGSDDLDFVLTHRLEQAYLDAATELNTTDDYVKSLMISGVAAKKFLTGLIELSNKL